MKWLLGAILMLLAALILQSGLLAYAMYVLLAVMLLSRFLARNWLAQVTAKRRCDTSTAEIGDEVHVEITIRNEGTLPVPWVLLEDLIPRQSIEQKPPRLKVHGKRLQIRMLPTGKEVMLSYDLECRMRGYYQIGPLLMESGDVFGLHRRYRVEAEPHFLTVYPRVVPLLGYDLASRRPIGDVQLVHRLFEDPTRIAGVRPYEAGDPLNRVHWRATARTGSLHCKIYEPSTLAGATLVLDFHKASYHRRGEPHRSELAVTTAVSLANAVYELGQQVGLISNGRDAADRIRLEGWDQDYRTRTAARKTVVMHEENKRLEPLVVETRRGIEQFQRIRETLARIELTDGLTGAELLIESANRIPRDATVVAILAEVSLETAIALASLKRQGFAVSAVLVLPEEGKLEESYGRLLAEGINDIRILKSEEEVPDLCRKQSQRATPYAMEMQF